MYYWYMLSEWLTPETKTDEYDKIYFLELLRLMIKAAIERGIISRAPWIFALRITQKASDVHIRKSLLMSAGDFGWLVVYRTHLSITCLITDNMLVNIRIQKKPYLLFFEDSLNVPSNMRWGIALLGISVRISIQVWHDFCLWQLLVYSGCCGFYFEYVTLPSASGNFHYVQLLSILKLLFSA